MKNIDYALLAKSQEYYKDLGYINLPLDWYVEKEFSDITFPEQKSIYQLPNELILVGSAEQAFIKKMLKEDLKGKYQSITPCFRNDEEDLLHSKTFMKNELFTRNNEVQESDLFIMLGHCKSFFNYHSKHKCEVVRTGELSYDINIKGIEVGSYGIREYHNGDKIYKWIYGTGLAEPRFSTVQNYSSSALLKGFAKGEYLENNTQVENVGEVHKEVFYG